MTVPSDDVRAQLRGFYEVEAAEETRGPAAGRRVEACRDFVDALVAGSAAPTASVLDLGAGPGTDAAAFTDAGLRYLGVDLAVANAALAARCGHSIVPASLFDLPVADDTFDALWTMSTLMHVPERELADAFAEIRRVVRPGALAGVGQWGGSLGDIMSDFKASNRYRRLFSLRTADQNQRLLAELGTVDRFEVWDVGPAGWEYHFAVLRVH